MEQEDRISASGDGDSDALAWMEHFEFNCVSEEAVEHYAYLMVERRTIQQKAEPAGGEIRAGRTR